MHCFWFAIASITLLYWRQTRSNQNEHTYSKPGYETITCVPGKRRKGCNSCSDHRLGNGATSDAAREKTSTQKCSLECPVAVHAATAETSDFARGIETG